ncbi:hypothetical protein Q0S21_03785 [Escherichia coli O93:H19]
MQDMEATGWRSFDSASIEWLPVASGFYQKMLVSILCHTWLIVILQIFVCAIEGEFRIKRYRTHPRPDLEDLADGRWEELPVDRENTSDALAVFGVIKYIINDARSGEFDDCPVI